MSTTTPGALFLANLRDAPGKLGLRAGESGAYFGVINIGDDIGAGDEIWHRPQGSQSTLVAIRSFVPRNSLIRGWPRTTRARLPFELAF